MGARIRLLIPRQSSRFSAMCNIMDDLYAGLSETGADPELYLLDVRDGEGAPSVPVRVVGSEEAVELLNSEESPLVTVDDYSIMRTIYDGGISNPSLTIWAHYFYGHSFFLPRYRDLRRSNFGAPLSIRALALLPESLWRRLSRFYWISLARHRVVAQSLWTALILGRTYNVPVSGILYPPIEPGYYVGGGEGRERRALVYLGGRMDTDLAALDRALRILGSEVPGIKFDCFGYEEVGRIYSRRFGVELSYLGKLDRADLGREYARHLVTVSPVYNGNFEMVPVESLLAGTPVITYLQPFIEVVGDTPLVANFVDEAAVRLSVGSWVSGRGLGAELEAMRKRILGTMDPRRIAAKLLE
ncbi:MAG: hypothetical protein ACP5ID_06295, partial [Conexivisphaera sp.]